MATRSTQCRDLIESLLITSTQCPISRVLPMSFIYCSKSDIIANVQHNELPVCCAQRTDNSAFQVLILYQRRRQPNQLSSPGCSQSPSQSVCRILVVIRNRRARRSTRGSPNVASCCSLTVNYKDWSSSEMDGAIDVRQRAGDEERVQPRRAKRADETASRVEQCRPSVVVARGCCCCCD